MNLYSYVVRYDSGFAPNPFYGVCTLATCKRRIRSSAKVGDWIIGSGSAARTKMQGGKLVYGMRISEALSFDEYFEDERFRYKKPILMGSRKQARGDNIYHSHDGKWQQLDSYHSNEDGTLNQEHVDIDTPINRVLISNHFRYFGGGGPYLPEISNAEGKALCHSGSGHTKFSDSLLEDRSLISDFIAWFEGLGELGYISHPLDWSDT